MMNALKPIAFDVLECLSQLFDYYLFAVSKQITAEIAYMYVCTYMIANTYGSYQYVYVHIQLVLVYALYICTNVCDMCVISAFVYM